MGEYADYILNGDDCQYCGEHLGDGDGFPRSCAACETEDEKTAKSEKKAYFKKLHKQLKASQK